VCGEIKNKDATCFILSEFSFGETRHFNICPFMATSRPQFEMFSHKTYWC